MVKLIPKYSYEYNTILNEKLTSQEQIQNFSSLLSDKDRFLPLIKLIEKNIKFIEEKLGYKLKDEIGFYVVRCEKFKSFSEPITIEYSILPQEMLLFLLKEIIKIHIKDRFIDEETREIYLNNFVSYLVLNLDDFSKFLKYLSNLHEESKKNYEVYNYYEIDFSKKSLKELVIENFKND